MNKKKSLGYAILFFLVILVIIPLISSSSVFADISCNITSNTTCTGNYGTLLKLISADGSGENNAHAALANANINYPYVLCCGDTTAGEALEANCTTGTTFLNLYSSINSHVQQANYSNYVYPACVRSPSSKSIACEYRDDSCNAGEECLVSISSSEPEDANTTNAHVANCSYYRRKVCCNFEKLSTPILNATDNPLNSSAADLNVYYDIGTSPNKTIVDWKKDSTSIATLNVPFEAGSTTILTEDFSNNSNNFTVDGATWQSSGGVDGFGAYDYDGSNDYAYAAVDGTTWTQMTLSFWVNPNETQTTQRGIVTWGATATDHSPFMGVYRETGTTDLKFYMDGAYRLDYAASNNAWHHVIVTRSDSELWTFYVDGVSRGTYQDTNTPSYIADADNIYLGSGYNGYFHGKIDELLLFNTSLNSDQITALYQRNQKIIDSELTFPGETWQACVTLFNTTDEEITKCSNSLVIQNVSQLNIYDEGDVAYIINTTAGTYYANYSMDSGTILNRSANNEGCNITFNVSGGWTSSAVMTFNATSHLYEYDKLITTAGTFNWNVTCFSDTELNRNATDTVNVYDPDISCWSCSDCETKIDAAPSSATITLIQNISSTTTCINTAKDDVTFDCANHLIDGDDGSTDYGIFLNGVSTSNYIENFNVYNCIFQDWGRSVYNEYGRYNEMKNLTFLSGGSGLQYYYSIKNNADNIYSDQGIVLNIQSSSDNNNFSNIESYNPGLESIYMPGGVDYNRVINFTGTGATSRGFYIDGNNNYFENCNLSSNPTGIYSASGSNNEFVNMTLYNNNEGFYLGGGGSNTINNSNIYDNSVAGINLRSDDNLIYNNIFNNSVNVYSGISNTVYTNDWNVTKRAGNNIIGGANIGGNYWSDYNGPDANVDGIIDKGRAIEMNNFDYLPLTNNPDSSQVCRIYDTAGTYTMSADITNINSSCILISASDIVFDCNNHNINGTDLDLMSAIQILGTSTNYLDNVTVKNCNLTNWYYGIKADYINNSNMLNIDLTPSYYGAKISYGENLLVENFTLYAATTRGFRLDYVTNSIFNNLTIPSSTYGIDVQYSNYNLFNDVHMNSAGYGFYVYYGGNNNFTNLLLDDGTSSNDAIYFGFSDHNLIDGCIIKNRNYDALYIALSDYNIIRNCNLTNNNREAIYVLGANYNNFTNINVSNNGIGFTGSGNYNIINNSYFVNSSSYGFTMSTAIGNLIYNNYFNNTININSLPTTLNYWNVTKRAGTNIIGNSSIGGNFWSDFNGPDSNPADGIVDYSKTIATNNIDYLPLTNNPTSEIPVCRDYDTPGIYNLSANVTDQSGSCIIITSSNVTIDCKNNYIDGVDASGTTGASVIGTTDNYYDNITIKNCNFTDWSTGIYYNYVNNSEVLNTSVSSVTSRGINYFHVYNSLIDEVNLNNNGGQGIRMEYAYYSNLTNSIVNGSTANIYLYYSYYNYLNNTNTSSGNPGLTLSQSDYNTVENIRSYSNINQNVLFSSSDNNVFRDSFLTDSTAKGLQINYASNNLMDNITVNDSATYGLEFYSASTNNNITNSNFTNNQYGIYMGSSNNIIHSNYVLYNTYGIRTASGSGNLIYNNYFNSTTNRYSTMTTSANSWNTTKTPGQNIAGGYFLGGNFWSDHSNVDSNSDGFADSTLPIVANNIDYLPLVLYSGVPPAPWLIAPNNGNNTLENPVNFTWYSFGEGVNYSINITSAVYSDILINNLTTANYARSDLGTGAEYIWTVKACNNVGCGSWNASGWNFSLLQTIGIQFTVNNTNFGSLLPSNTSNTSTDNPAPMIIENTGGVSVNITLNATQMFSLSDLGNNTFQFKFRENETGSFNTSTSTMTWTNVSATNADVLNELLSTDSADSAKLDLLVRVPMSEPPGTKSSTLTISAVES